MTDEGHTIDVGPVTVGSAPEHGKFVSLVVGKEAAMMPVTRYVEAFFWSCQECGWLGSRLGSLNAAMQEAGQHYAQTHGIEGLTSPPLVERRDQLK